MTLSCGTNVGDNALPPGPENNRLNPGPDGGWNANAYHADPARSEPLSDTASPAESGGVRGNGFANGQGGLNLKH